MIVIVMMMVVVMMMMMMDVDNKRGSVIDVVVPMAIRSVAANASHKGNITFKWLHP